MPEIKKINDTFEIIGFTQTIYNEEEERRINNFGFKYVPYEILRKERVDYICILCGYEWEIRRFLFENDLCKKAIITDIGEIMLQCFGLGLDEAYQALYRCTPNAVKKVICQVESYKYLKRTYAHVILEHRELIAVAKPKVAISKDITPVWMVWLQGMENAPSVIRLCIERVKKILREGEQLFLLDESNLFEYVDFPEYIINKFKDGVIGYAHFTDLIRLRLLNVYGGIYIDSDIYFMSDHLPDYVIDTEMFVYSIYANWRDYVEPRVATNWMISAKPMQRMLVVLENLLYEYWLKENKLIHWLIYHQFFTMIAEVYPEDFDRVETVLTWSSIVLRHEINAPYDEKRFSHIENLAEAQKLSHRETYLLKTQDGRDTFWGYLLKKNHIGN